MARSIMTYGGEARAQTKQMTGTAETNIFGPILNQTSLDNVLIRDMR